ncbi:MAG: nucleotidyl transferase AbiEii/AbiGii toxin family protein [candidate division WOR-3 bacterium]
MLDIQKHKYVLVQILKDIYSDKEISPLMGFKGGTAAYLFYDLPRFSVDLDFNLLEILKKDLVRKKTEHILKDHGNIKTARDKRYTIFFMLSYGKEATNIKVEISKRKFPDSYEVKNYLGIPMLAMKKKDIFAHKLVAFPDRKSITNRDIFDLWFFLKNNWEINKKIVELRTGKEFKDSLKYCIKAAKRINEMYILQGLGEIPDKEQKNWAKNNLKKDLIFLMKNYLETS